MLSTYSTLFRLGSFYLEVTKILFYKSYISFVCVKHQFRLFPNYSTVIHRCIYLVYDTVNQIFLLRQQKKIQVFFFKLNKLFYTCRELNAYLISFLGGGGLRMFGKKNEQNDKNYLVLKSFCNLNKVISFLVSLVYLLDMHCIIPNIYLFLDC